MITLICALLLFIILFFIGFKIFFILKRERVISKFPDYKGVLNYHMEKAYDMIYKDQVLTYSIEATTTPEKEYNKALKEFIKLVVKMIGKRLHKEFIFLYGDNETFSFNLAEFFVSKYDSDEIREAAKENLMETEVDETEGP